MSVPSLAGPLSLVRARILESLPIATDARLAGDDKEARLIVDLTRKMDVQALHGVCMSLAPLVDAREAHSAHMLAQWNHN